MMFHNHSKEQRANRKLKKRLCSEVLFYERRHDGFNAAIFLIRTSFLTLGVSGCCFCLSRDIYHLKAGAVMPLVEECGLAAVIFELPAHFSVESPVRKAFVSAIRADLSRKPLFSMRHAWM